MENEKWKMEVGKWKMEIGNAKWHGTPRPRYYPLPKEIKGLGKKAVAKAFATACRHRYKKVGTAKKIFHYQLFIWLQLAVSEGFGRIIYCLANSN